MSDELAPNSEILGLLVSVPQNIQNNGFSKKLDMKIREKHTKNISSNKVTQRQRTGSLSNIAKGQLSNARPRLGMA